MTTQMKGILVTFSFIFVLKTIGAILALILLLLLMCSVPMLANYEMGD